MARCCNKTDGALCSCLIEQGPGVRVTGNGSLEDPYAIEVDFNTQWARNLDQLIVGAIVRDGNGAALSADVVWPDGTVGEYVADSISVGFPGMVDAYHVTYGSPVIRTYSQPLVTRDVAGAVINLPAIVVT